MPIHLEVKRKLCTRTDRVKCVEFHPVEPWILSCLYNGTAVISNFETQSIVKSFEVSSTPVRAGKFVVRKNWVIFGSDDMMIRVFNYNTMEKVKEFEAHADYIRSIIVHPTQPFVLTSSDDMSIKMWDWNSKWTTKSTFEGHIHYIMQLAFNPKDSNTFASASLDRTIKVWQLGSLQSNFTLEGHERGVNCISYYSSGDKPYLISGGDDNVVKIWDYQNKSCVQTLEAHFQNINFVLSHPTLPLFISGSEDGTVKCWHSNTYRLESTLNYGLERCWAGCCLPGLNEVGIGYDIGTVVVKLGREHPAVSMDKAGKVIWAKHCEIQQTNTVGVGADLPDGSRLPVSVKDMGSCEVYPITVQYSQNGRFVAVCGDGEYIIYTSMALRNKAYGQAQEFVWSSEASLYATRQGCEVEIFKNFKQASVIKVDLSTCAMFGGPYLGVASKDSLCFYDWDTGVVICRVEICAKAVYWSDSGDFLAVIADEDAAFYVLSVDSEKIAGIVQAGGEDEGDEEVMTVLDECAENVISGIWTADCFIYTTSTNKLNYYIGGETISLAHLDRLMHVLGYAAADNRVLLIDKDLAIIARSLPQTVLDYQSTIMRKELDVAKSILPSIPNDFRTKVAQFLEKQELFADAFAVTADPAHKFELAYKLKDLDHLIASAHELSSEYRWKQVCDMALKVGRVDLVKECLLKANDAAGLLMWARVTSDKQLMIDVGEKARLEKNYNLAFMAFFCTSSLQKCLDVLLESNRIPEAAFFCHTYMPSQLQRVSTLWKQMLGKKNKRLANLIATPNEYANLFPKLDELIVREKMRDLSIGEQQSDKHEPNDQQSVIVQQPTLVSTVQMEAQEYVVYSDTSNVEQDDDEDVVDEEYEAIDIPEPLFNPEHNPTDINVDQGSVRSLSDSDAASEYWETMDDEE